MKPKASSLRREKMVKLQTDWWGKNKRYKSPTLGIRTLTSLQICTYKKDTMKIYEQFRLVNSTTQTKQIP